MTGLFDFGNVLARWDVDYVLDHAYTGAPADRALFRQTVFSDWERLDWGLIPYRDYAASCRAQLPARLHDACDHFFAEWMCYLTPYEKVVAVTQELHARGDGVYLLSNACTRFSERLMELYGDALAAFDGILVSADIGRHKPDADFYEYAFERFSLNAADCVFFDDLEKNVRGALACGIDAHVFTGDVAAMRRALRLPPE